MKTLEISDETYEKIKGQIKEDTKKIEIRNIDGEIIYISNKSTLKEAVEEAVENEADLRGAYLREADLRRAYLRGADFYGANLRGANFSGAYLRGANLRKADLCEANLYGANLRGANLYEANLRGADLCETKFYGSCGTETLTKEQVPVFLEALGFKII